MNELSLFRAAADALYRVTLSEETKGQPQKIQQIMDAVSDITKPSSAKDLIAQAAKITGN